MRNQLIFAGLLAVACDVAAAAVHELTPTESIQQTIDRAAAGDVIVLGDGVYHEAIDIDKPGLTIRAANPGKATITNRHDGDVIWRQAEGQSHVWFAEGIDWPVHGMRVEGLHAFDYRTRDHFDKRECGPYWSKAWQAERKRYTSPPISFAHDAPNHTLWLRLNDNRDPNNLTIDFNSRDVDARTLVQKDLGTAWNQQQIVVISKDPPEHPITHWYDGTPEHPAKGRKIDFPKMCGTVIQINADDVKLEGLRITMGPTVGVEVNNASGVTIRDCYFAGYQFAINTGYECTKLTVEHCEFDGGKMVSFGRNGSAFEHMWNHSTYIIPIKFNGTGLTFKHNYIYEGFDLFQPRGRHKDFAHVPDIPSEVAYNVWHIATDNALEFDGVEAMLNMRVHHNLVLENKHDALAITTTEAGSPLLIDHNIFWPAGRRIMKLAGTGRTNRGVIFAHNTYFAGAECSYGDFADSAFDNNIVISDCQKSGCWTAKRLGDFFPSRYNLLQNGERYTEGFEGPTADPQFGTTPQTIFALREGSPAIDAGLANEAYQQDNMTDGKPDLGALEFGETIEDWRKRFGHCGPRWITADNAAELAPIRPGWPKQIDPRWGGLE